MVERDIFQWHNEYSTGIPQIDSQHKEMIKLINILLPFYDLNDSKSRETFYLMLSNTKKYFEHHFETEEGIMLEKYYPKYEEHKQEHRKMLVRMNKMMKETDENNNMVIKNVLVFLQEWVTKHLYETDKEMGKYFIERSHTV